MPIQSVHNRTYPRGKEMFLLAATEFKIFAQLLATKYRKSRKAEDFAQELFKEIYLPETEDNPVEDTLPRTYRGYYSGQNDISELASQIAGFLDVATHKKNASCQRR